MQRQALADQDLLSRPPVVSVLVWAEEDRSPCLANRSTHGESPPPPQAVRGGTQHAAPARNDLVNVGNGLCLFRLLYCWFAEHELHGDRLAGAEGAREHHPGGSLSKLLPRYEQVLVRNKIRIFVVPGRALHAQPLFLHSTAGVKKGYALQR